jgi:hypothetical protein
MKDRRFVSAVAFMAAPWCFVPAIKMGNLVLWIRTHWCVAEVACDVCGAKVGEACRNKRGEQRTGTHYQRRKAATWGRRGRLIEEVKRPGAKKGAISGA